VPPASTLHPHTPPARLSAPSKAESPRGVGPGKGEFAPPWILCSTGARNRRRAHSPYRDGGTAEVPDEVDDGHNHEARRHVQHARRDFGDLRDGGVMLKKKNRALIVCVLDPVSPTQLYSTRGDPRRELGVPRTQLHRTTLTTNGTRPWSPPRRSLRSGIW